MNDDPQFRSARLIERYRGPVETARLSRGEDVLKKLIGQEHEEDFYRAFSERCGPAFPTALSQLLSFAESRCDPDARKRDKAMAMMIRSWKNPGIMDAIYLNACVERYARDKAWAQSSDIQRERAIDRKLFGGKLSENSTEGAIGKAKEAGLAILLTAGLSFASDSMAVIDKLPGWMHKPLVEAAESGAKALAILHDFSPLGLGNAAMGLAAAAAVIYGKSILSASWTVAKERRKRVSASHEIPRSLSILDRDHAWEPHLLSRPEFWHGLQLKDTPPAWDAANLDALSANRHAIGAHCAAVALEVKQAWSLLTANQRESAKAMPANEAIAIAARAISGMRAKAQLGGYGSSDYASLALPESQIIARRAFDELRNGSAANPKPVGSPDPLGVREKLLARRPRIIDDEARCVTASVKNASS